MDKKTLSILVVDDDKIVRFIHKKLIESLTQFRIIYYEAINGMEAMQTLKHLVIYGKKLPDLILLDLNMPVLDGFGFIETFQQTDFPNKEKTQIVIVSSSENGKDLKRSFELGIDLFVSKPITKEILEMTIQQQLAIAA